MAAWVWVLIAVGVVAVLAVVLSQAVARRRPRRPQRQVRPRDEPARGGGAHRGDPRAGAAGGGGREGGRAGGERGVGAGRQGTGAKRGAQQQLKETPLLPAEQGEDFTSRGREIQTSFVDEPRDSGEKADALVGDMMQPLAAI